MKERSNSPKDTSRPAKALPVEGGVVNRTDRWQRTEGGAEKAGGKSPQQPADAATPDDAGDE